MYFYRILSLTVIFLTGCFNQEPHDISSNIESSETSVAKKACLKSNLKTNLLEQQNSIAIFECIGWNKEYPNLYKLIHDFPSVQYTKISKRPNEILFGNKPSKDKFFTILEEHGVQDDFKGLNSLVTLFLKSNGLLKSLNEIQQELTQAKPSHGLLALAKNEDLNIKLVKTFFKFKNNLKLTNADLIPFEFIANNTEFRKLLVMMIDSTINSMQDKTDIMNISRFVNQENWPYSWLQQLNDQQFLDLFLFVGQMPNEISKNSRIVRDKIFSEFVCEEYSGTYVFDHGKELFQRMHKLVDMDINSFYADYMDLLQSYSLFKNVCSRKAQEDKSLKSFMHAADQVFTVAHKAFSMHGGFELIKNIAKLTLDGNAESSASLLELMHSDFFKAYMKLIRHLMQFDGFEDYISLWIKEIKNTDQQTLVNISELLKLYAKDSFLRDSLIEIWNEIDHENKDKLLAVGLDFVLDLESTESVDMLFDAIMREFPGLLNIQHNDLSDMDLNIILEHLATSFENPLLQTEIKAFLSSQSFFQLIELMGENRSAVEVTQHETPVEDGNYVLDADEELESCFAWLGEKLSRGVDFWSLIDGYPAKCERKVGNYLSTHVLNWTLIIDSKFIDLTGRKFSVPYGVIAPDMMEYYLDLILLVNKYAVHGDKYVARIVETIEKHLFQYGFLEAMDSGLKVVNQVNQQTKFLSSFLYKLAIRDSERSIDLDEDLKHFVKDWYYYKPPTDTIAKDPVCKDLVASFTPLTCMTNSQVSDYYERFSEIILKKNVYGVNALGVMLDALYPDKTFKIPFDSKKYYNYNLKLYHLIRFVYDLPDSKYKKSIKFYGPDNYSTIDATIGERLEIVIREINFLNNFYGAHFMNKVSRAKNFKDKIRSLKKQMSMLSKMGNFLRNRGVLPPESKWKIKNVLENYESLSEVADQYPQPDRAPFSYQDVVQTLMIIAVKSSAPNATDFNAIRFPKAELANGHNGKLITMGTELSAITRIGKLLRRFYPAREQILNDKDFQRVSDNLHNYISYDVAYDILKYALEHKNTKLMVSDLVKIVDGLTTKQVKQLVSIAANVFKVFDVHSSGALDRYTPLLKVFLENYSMIRQELVDVNIGTFINGLESFSTVFVEYKKGDAFKYFGSLVQEVLDEKIDIIKELIPQKNFWHDVKNVVVSFDYYLTNSSKLESAELVIELLQDDKFDFDTLVRVVERVYAEEGNLDYFDQILTVLAHEKNDRSNLYLAVEEIFKKKKAPLIEFLESVLSKVRYKN